MPDLLKIDQLSAGYGEAVVLSRISLALAEGQALALLGRNGMGKTTLINTIVGVTRYFSGTIMLDGRDITRLRPDQRAHAGIGWVPQERNIFKSLTVHENLTAIARPGRWTPDKVYAMFPRLNERRQNLGNQLSGGEQQMLAVGRALVLNPRVLLLDEPLEGLAPIIVEELLKALRRIIRDEERQEDFGRHRPCRHCRARRGGARSRQRGAVERSRRTRDSSWRHRYRHPPFRPLGPVVRAWQCAEEAGAPGVVRLDMTWAAPGRRYCHKWAANLPTPATAAPILRRTALIVPVPVGNRAPLFRDML
jgi:branched-chain amino acid transport system ATP-binding protein